MFGLKIIKSKHYAELNEQIAFTQNLLVDKDIQIAELQSKVVALEKQIKSCEKDKKITSDVILLTDVAEQPLEVETKPVKRTRTRKSTKSKTTKSTTRKRSTKQTEN